MLSNLLNIKLSKLNFVRNMFTYKTMALSIFCLAKFQNLFDVNDISDCDKYHHKYIHIYLYINEK